MRTAGVRELKDNATQLVRLVREEQQSINITYYGEVVARLIPVTPTPDSSDIWTSLDQLSAEIGAAWQGEANSETIMDDERR